MNPTPTTPIPDNHIKNHPISKGDVSILRTTEFGRKTFRVPFSVRVSRDGRTKGPLKKTLTTTNVTRRGAVKTTLNHSRISVACERKYILHIYVY